MWPFSLIRKFKPIAVVKVRKELKFYNSFSTLIATEQLCFVLLENGFKKRTVKCFKGLNTGIKGKDKDFNSGVFIWESSKEDVSKMDLNSMFPGCDISLLVQNKEFEHKKEQAFNL